MSESDTRGNQRNPTDRGSSIESDTISNPATTDAIDADDLYEALSNRRRRQVIRALENGQTEIGALARAIAAVENDIPVDAVHGQQRKRVYISLYQVHLDKLDDWSIVEWDDVHQTVTPGPAHECALDAMAAVSEPHDEPTPILERVVNFFGGGA